MPRRRLTATRTDVHAAPGAHTTPAATAPGGPAAPRLDDFSAGYLVGLLAGEGHFGGDGRQPQVTLRMHVRHEKIFRWLVETFPEARLYGPYHHGGRHYYQWMARGAFLREVLAPLVASRLDRLDDYVAERFRNMCARYGIRPANTESAAP
jgi:hypothetical protein